jgi:sugar lactone lactonase YvrE
VSLNSPWDLVQLGSRLLIAMAGSHQIWQLQLEHDRISTLLGTGAEACIDGTTEVAAFAQPSGITTDGKELFVADSEGSTIRAIKLDVELGSQPQVRTICGSGDLFSYGDRDGQGEQVRLQHCMGVEYAGNNQLWIADTYNHKIKQVDIQAGVCRTVLGSGDSALQAGQGTMTSFYEPSGLSLADDQLWIADTNHHVVRRVDLKTLEVTTLIFEGLCAPNLCLRTEG